MQKKSWMLEAAKATTSKCVNDARASTQELGSSRNDAYISSVLSLKASRMATNDGEEFSDGAGEPRVNGVTGEAWRDPDSGDGLLRAESGDCLDLVLTSMAVQIWAGFFAELAGAGGVATSKGGEVETPGASGSVSIAVGWSARTSVTSAEGASLSISSATGEAGAIIARRTA